VFAPSDRLVAAEDGKLATMPSKFVQRCARAASVKIRQSTQPGYSTAWLLDFARAAGVTTIVTARLLPRVLRRDATDIRVDDEVLAEPRLLYDRQLV
jgi:hypothetical protein